MLNCIMILHISTTSLTRRIDFLFSKTQHEPFFWYSFANDPCIIQFARIICFTSIHVRNVTFKRFAVICFICMPTPNFIKAKTKLFAPILTPLLTTNVKWIDTNGMALQCMPNLHISIISPYWATIKLVYLTDTRSTTFTLYMTNIQE